MTPAYLALGSNLGDRKATLDAAIAALGETPGIVVRAVSSYHETNPIGGPGGQGSFLNAAAAIETRLEPRGLMLALQAIEDPRGRVRDVRWDQRTLDLDILLYGDTVVDEPDLTIPHPRMAVRRFVLTPLAGIAPNAVDPLTRRTISDLIANLDRKPAFVCLIGMSVEVFRRVAIGLNAIGLYSYGAETDAFAILDRKAREFDLERWSDQIWGDRWMLSDFWPDLMVRDATFRLDGSDRERWLDLYRARQSGIIRPTFVTAHPYSFSQLRKWADQNLGDSLGGADIPLLCPGYADPFRYSEQTGTSARLDAITTEIIAACAACRDF